MRRMLVLLRARRWMPLSLLTTATSSATNAPLPPSSAHCARSTPPSPQQAGLRSSGSGSLSTQASFFSVRASPPSSSSSPSAAVPTATNSPGEAPTTNNNSVPPSSASTSSSSQQQASSSFSSSSSTSESASTTNTSNTAAEGTATAAAASADGAATSTNNGAAMFGSISLEEFQRAMRDREFASHLIQHRLWKEEYAIYLLCMVCFCLVYYSTTSSIRHTRRRCELLEQRTKEEMELLRTTLKSTLDRWEKDLLSRDEKIHAVHARNCELTKMVENMTTAIKTCNITTTR